jgi:hypothetical protein
MRPTGKALAVTAVLCLAGSPGEARSQTLASRVDEVEQGWVTFQVDVSPGVEICDRAIRIRGTNGRDDSHWHWDGDSDGTCGPGPMQVELEREAGVTRSIRARRVRPLEGARALGPVTPTEASEYLVSLAYRDTDRKVAEQGFFLARLPRNADPAPGIIRAARDRDLPTDVRKSALFWAGQLAADQVVAPLSEVARDDEQQSVREAAVFALSQHQGERALPVLMELATDAPHAGTRRSALFWLAQRDEPQVADFLAGIILGRSGG